MLMCATQQPGTIVMQLTRPCLKHICACSIAEMLECTSLMAFVGAGALFISEPSHAPGCKACGKTRLDVSHGVANLCRGAASTDAQETYAYEHHHSERHTGHQLSDVHLGSPPEQEKVLTPSKRVWTGS